MIRFTGSVWRIVFADRATDPLEPARAPEGRFHHSAQSAIYTSLSPDGAGIAIARYLDPDDPPRCILRFTVAAMVEDLRARPDPKAASVVWQEGPRPSPTWALSDAARARRADGVLYRSRSRPELTHLTLFDPGVVQQIDAPEVWPPTP